GRELGGALGCSPDVVDTACLAHDLGHPPFGHNGERVLAQACADIGGFEGNAQTLRLLTRLEAKRFHDDGRSAGLNLTRASLDAATKYPWTAGSRPGPKFGVYADDLEVFTWLREGADGTRRCLEAQVMDWADDVGYSVHDIEDAVAAGLVHLGVLGDRRELAAIAEVAVGVYAPDLTEADVVEAADRLLATGQIVETCDGRRSALAALKDMTSMLVGRFVRSAEEATRQRYGDGTLTRYGADLVVPFATRAECVVLKAIAAHYVMFTPARREILAAEEGVMVDLLAAYRADPEATLDPLHRADHTAATDDAARLRVVVDQIASLTDVRARALHRQWCS
ncbi:MAG: deoxyguanosinetriphosphate triphosphohydrolase, partial [Mobilicoccus sp.]|nr:deoxyguanosinetriphosphate triphosphohydrolase [Mobilicoccus sp.]